MLKVRNNILGLFDAAVENTLKSTGIIADQYNQEALEYERILIEIYRLTESELKLRADEVSNAVKKELQRAYNKAYFYESALFKGKRLSETELLKIAESNNWKLDSPIECDRNSARLESESYSDADSGL